MLHLLLLFLLFIMLGLSLPVIQMICSLAMFNAFCPQTNTIRVLYSAKFTKLVECLIQLLTYYSMVPALDRSALKCTFYYIWQLPSNYLFTHLHCFLGFAIIFRLVDCSSYCLNNLCKLHCTQRRDSSGFAMNNEDYYGVNTERI